MNIEELRSFVDNYEIVGKKIEDVFDLLQGVDAHHWTTGRRIISWEIEGRWVLVTYDDSSMGCWDEGSNSFDAEWLFLSDDELTEAAWANRREREEMQRVKNEEKQRIETENKEKREREQYEKLKAKFEPK